MDCTDTKTFSFLGTRNRKRILKEDQKAAPCQAGAKVCVRVCACVVLEPSTKAAQRASWETPKVYITLEIPGHSKNRMSLKCAVKESVLNMLYMATLLFSFYTQMAITSSTKNEDKIKLNKIFVGSLKSF